jgi:predicted amidophosphoribosyltransferase
VCLVPAHLDRLNGSVILSALLDVLAPPACAACGDALARAGPVLCPPCTRSLPWLRGGCPFCALPAHRGKACPARTASFARAWAPLAYAGPARRVVQGLKFGGRLPLAETMAAQIAAGLPRELRDGSVVPVPASRARRRRRGFDAAELLAAALAVRLELPYAAVLRRSDRSRRHTRAGLSGRRDEGLELRVAGPAPRVALLLDDVHTTGATLEACAAALRAAGTRRVVAISYARTL